MQKQILIFLVFSLFFLTGCSKPVNFSFKDNNGFISKPDIFSTEETLEQQLAVSSQFSAYYIKGVPFVSQAPLRVWDDLHNEACEEAAVLTVVSYRQGKNGVSEQEADEGIKAAVKWQEENFGGHYDLPLNKTKEMAELLYGREISIVEAPTKEQIKAEISKNNPVIVPASGRALGNPNFRQPGPVYHMLVVRGYDDEKGEFITNDVGTRKGENYRYQYQKLYDAIHDMPAWPKKKADLDADPNMIFSGQKAMLIVH